MIGISHKTKLLRECRFKCPFEIYKYNGIVPIRPLSLDFPSYIRGETSIMG